MMKATKFNPSHRGWLGICPVYISGIGTDDIMLQERHILMLPLLWFSILMMGICILILTLANDDYEPMFPVRITGRIEPCSQT